MRSRTRKAPLVDVPKTATRCCSGTFTAQAEELKRWQRVPYGTTGWSGVYHRRSAVEGVNGTLKSDFVSLRRGFHRVFGLTGIALLMTFTLIGTNLYKLASEARRQPSSLPRTKRRKGTLPALLGET
jgi:hypothetical protein